MNAKVDASHTLDLLDGYIYGGSKIRKCYFATNELIPNYLEFFDLNDKNVLTVTGSGDQIFYSLLAGAKNIDTIDINPLSYYVLELKLAAIKSLDSKTYSKFIPTYDTFAGDDNFFDKRIYDYISSDMPEDAKEFWNILYSRVKNPKEFLYLAAGLGYIKPKSSYFDKTNFDLLKLKLSIGNITFYQGNAFSLPSDLKLKRDYYGGILLSNIYDYNPSYDEKRYLQFIDSEIKPMLTKDGTCLAYYGFGDNYYNFRETPKIELLDELHHERCSAILVKKRG